MIIVFELLGSRARARLGTADLLDNLITGWLEKDWALAVVITTAAC
jgi:hypothetical protein